MSTWVDTACVVCGAVYQRPARVRATGYRIRVTCSDACHIELSRQRGLEQWRNWHAKDVKPTGGEVL